MIPKLIMILALAATTEAALPLAAEDVLVTDTTGKTVGVMDITFHCEGVANDQKGGIPVYSPSGTFVVPWSGVKEIRKIQNSGARSAWGNAPQVVAPKRPVPTAAPDLLPPGMQNEDNPATTPAKAGAAAQAVKSAALPKGMENEANPRPAPAARTADGKAAAADAGKPALPPGTDNEANTRSAAASAVQTPAALPKGMENEANPRSTQFPAAKPKGIRFSLAMMSGAVMEVEIVADSLTGEFVGADGLKQILLENIDKIVPMAAAGKK